MQKLPHFLKTIASDLSSVWIIATVGACFGFTINQFRDNPLPLVYSPKAERIQQAVAKLTTETTAPNKPSSAANLDVTSPSDVPKVHQIDLQAFRDIVEGKTKGIVLDARPEIFHRLGHVPGAISLPREEFQESYSKQRALLDRNKSQPIAIYCSSASCEDSQMVADALVKLAYTRVFVFKGGWSEWTDAHLTEEKAQ
jgi:3-mercaptopyruvate sulfurtransferase SseA